MFNMRKIFCVILLLLCLAGVASAAEQRAYALKDPVMLYAKADENSRSWEVSLPENGVSVPSAIRDKSNALWYKVTVDGRTGWLFNEGIRLRMGGKSKFAANAFKRCVSAAQKIIKNPGSNWEEGEALENSGSAAKGGNVVTYLNMNGGVFQIVKNGSKRDFVYFRSSAAGICNNFLGFNPIGLDKDELRRKVGTPTVRETPDGERDVSITSYESTDGNMTLAFHLRNDIVEWFELYKGRTGEANKGWSPDTLYERDQI